jgi:hypothetical protein
MLLIFNYITLSNMRYSNNPFFVFEKIIAWYITFYFSIFLIITGISVSTNNDIIHQVLSCVIFAYALLFFII